MIRFLEKVAFSVERNLKNTPIAFRIYSIIFVFCVVVFGFYGVLPLSRILKAKIAITKEMDVASKTMQANLRYAQQAAVDISENKERIVLLDRYMPQETNVQTYMLDFIDSIGASGFTLKNFTQDTSNKAIGQIDINLTLEGTVYPTDVIKNVEILKRVTQVKRVNVYQNSKGVLTVNLVLTIYTLII